MAFWGNHFIVFLICRNVPEKGPLHFIAKKTVDSLISAEYSKKIFVYVKKKNSEKTTRMNIGSVKHDL